MSQAETALTKLIEFRKVNLIQKNYPIATKFDVILCRNVLYYFDPITPSFTKSFCNSLDHDSQLTVQLGTEGAYLRRGHAYLAPGDQHMLLRRTGDDLTLTLSGHDRVNRHRPSVDELFKSVADLRLLPPGK